MSFARCLELANNRPGLQSLPLIKERLVRRNESTFPRLAEALGFVGKEDIFHVVKAIVATQRDYGRRDDRKQSRLKYLVNDWGIDKFRLVVEQYFGKKLMPFRCAPLSLASSGTPVRAYARARAQLASILETITKVKQCF